MKLKMWMLCLLLLLPALPGIAGQALKIPCEVLETSGSFNTNSNAFKGMHYMLVHQANAADRETLSTWLKAHSGTEIRFIVREKKYPGILCRMAYCFGRGLLLYTDKVTVADKDIIEVILPQ
ncbi:MAG: hypothetical protein DRH37_07195 [Deltaproteobacteria bacterium]|nr:MAG: hypothetical protein DRH37_07195 [Deltaproteobacteria bacterium]